MTDAEQAVVLAMQGLAHATATLVSCLTAKEQLSITSQKRQLIEAKRWIEIAKNQIDSFKLY